MAARKACARGGLLKEIRHDDRLMGTQGLPKQSQVFDGKTPLPPMGDASVPTPLSSTPAPTRDGVLVVKEHELPPMGDASVPTPLSSTPAPTRDGVLVVKE